MSSRYFICLQLHSMPHAHRSYSTLVDLDDHSLNQSVAYSHL